MQVIRTVLAEDGALLREGLAALLGRFGFEVVAAPMGYLGVPNGRPAGGWLPEAKAVWQSGILLNEAIGLLAYPLAYD